MAAVLTISPNPILPSGTLDVHGEGFGKSGISLSLDGTTYISKFRPQGDGTFDIGVTVSATVGTYNLKATVGSSVVATASVVVKAAAPPPPPVVTFSQTFTEGQQISGTVTWVATILTGTVTNVDFVVDGVTHWPELQAPWGGAFDSTAFPDGPHAFRVTCYSTSGNVSQTVNATINNAVVIPLPNAPTNLTAVPGDKKVVAGWQ